MVTSVGVKIASRKAFIFGQGSFNSGGTESDSAVNACLFSFSSLRCMFYTHILDSFEFVVLDREGKSKREHKNDIIHVITFSDVTYIGDVR